MVKLKSLLNRMLNWISAPTGPNMTTEELNAWLNSLNRDFRGTVDWIVEEGIDGIWTYRKWDSGIVECWGLATISNLTWASYLSTGLYYTNPNWEIDFPFSIISPRVTATIVKTGSNIGWVANANYSGEKAFLSVVRNGNSGETSAVIHVIGRWK